MFLLFAFLRADTFDNMGVLNPSKRVICWPTSFDLKCVVVSFSIVFSSTWLTFLLSGEDM